MGQVAVKVRWLGPTRHTKIFKYLKMRFASKFAALPNPMVQSTLSKVMPVLLLVDVVQNDQQEQTSQSSLAISCSHQLQIY